MATCVALPPGRLPWLAVALKPSKKALRCSQGCLSSAHHLDGDACWNAAADPPTDVSAHGVHLFIHASTSIVPTVRSCRFMAYELQPGSSSQQQQQPQVQLLGQAEVPDAATAVHGMGWVGAQLAVCAGVRYLLVAPLGGSGGQWRELFAVPDELAYCPAMLATMPDLGRALMVVVSAVHCSRWWRAGRLAWRCVCQPAVAGGSRSSS